MRKHRKSWTEKLNESGEPVVKPCPVHIAGMKPGQVMLIPTPRLIDRFVRGLPPGTSLSVAQLRAGLADQFGAEVTCPITTGFHLRTVAEAAVEGAASANDWSDVTPFWRVIDERSPTFARLSFDTSVIRHQRALEGLD
jgi:hypothetical protein